MTNGQLVLVGLLMVVGLFGVVVPVLPGLVITLAAALWWAMATGGATAWTVFAVIAAIFVVATVGKYVLAARTTARGGAHRVSLLVGVALGVVGFFVVAVIGAPIGFVLGVYLSERARNPQTAWPATKAALKGVGLSVLVEFCAGALMLATWLGGVLLT